MTLTFYAAGTEYAANQITLLRGSAADIVSVGVYHDTDPSVRPEVADFTAVTLVDGTEEPLPALAEDGKIDVLSLIGARVSADVTLTPGDYQRWVLISTADEDIIRPVDTITVL